MKTRKRFRLNFAPYFRSARRSTARTALCLAACMLGLGITVMAQQPPIITFDAPGAYHYTFGVGINASGAIIGYYADANAVYHSFLRAPDGHFTTFTDPDACTSSDPSCVYLGTGPMDINEKGTITGPYTDASLVNHGWLLTPQGRLTNFDAPGAGTGAGEGTWGNCINPAGEIAGEYQDTSLVYHMYLRAPDGTMTTFDAPNVGTGEYQGTYSDFFGHCLNPEGAVTGYYWDTNWVGHGYLRSRDGIITEFDAPSAGSTPGSGEGTFPMAINADGTIAGFVQDNSELTHGFVRTHDGRFTTFDVPGAGTVPDSWQGTYPLAINPAGAIAGDYLDASYVYHGFLRTPDGKITTFDAPGAGTGEGQGTYAQSINSAGEITGYYWDAAGMAHGFLRLP